MSDPVIDLLADEWAAISAFGHDLTEAEWKTATALPGWTVQDCVAHIAGTERMLLGEAAPTHDVSHLPHVRDDFGAMMEVWVQDYRHLTGAATLSSFSEVIGRRVGALRAMSDDELDVVGWSPIGQVPYRVFMRVRLFDSWMHEQDMRRALDRPGHLSGPVADASLARFDAALGAIVGKRAAAPEGATVVFDVRGEPDRQWSVAVIDGRAKVLGADDTPPPSPTVRIELPVTSFVALGGGRWNRTEAEAAGGVVIDGDTQLATRILDNFAFTP
jgi:uncharacterized protein (TIGR03083 family)